MTDKRQITEEVSGLMCGVLTEAQVEALVQVLEDRGHIWFNEYDGYQFELPEDGGLEWNALCAAVAAATEGVHEAPSPRVVRLRR